MDKFSGKFTVAQDIFYIHCDRFTNHIHLVLLVLKTNSLILLYIKMGHKSKYIHIIYSTGNKYTKSHIITDIH